MTTPHRGPGVGVGLDIDIDLDELRQLVDPPADTVAAAFAATLPPAPDGGDESPRLILALRTALRTNPRPPMLDDWLTTPGELPDWADMAMLHLAQATFQRWSLQICGALWSASLPFCYAAANGAEVLGQVSDLAGSHVRRRLVETGQMLIDVHEPCETPLGPASRGADTIGHVRLMHAVVRACLVGQPNWNPAWGAPINQEDLLGTQLSFTVVAFDALHRLGVRLTPVEQQALCHLWAVIGTRLGVIHARTIESVEASVVVRDRIVAHQHSARPVGEQLAAALVADLERAMPRGLRKVPRTMMWRAAGPSIARLLNVPRPAWWAPVLVPLAAIGRSVTGVPGVRRVSGVAMRVLGAAALRMFIDDGLAGDAPPFGITAEQHRRWHLRHGGVIRRALRRRRLAGRPRPGPGPGPGPRPRPGRRPSVSGAAPTPATSASPEANR